MRDQEQSKATQKGERTNADQRGTDDTPLVVKVAPGPNAEQEAAEAKKEKEAKTAAERRIEITTWIVAFATLLQAIGLGVTIWVMVRTARRQLRAYVFVDGIGLYDASQMPALTGTSEGSEGATPPAGSGLGEDVPAGRPRGMPGVSWGIKNSGQTPAYDVVHWGAFDVLETRLEHAVVVPPLDPTLFKTYLAPGAIMTKAQWYNRALTEQEIADIRSGARAVYVFGRIEYKDAFKQKRFTTYRLKYTASAYPPVAPTGFNYCQDGNDAD